MKVVIDSNRIIAAMIKERTTREIIFNKNFKFIAPDYMITEIHKYKNYIIKKAGIKKEEFEILLSLIFEHITIIPKSEYYRFNHELKNEIKDIKDISYFAVCFATKAEGIWTHDSHFLGQNKIKIFSNFDLLRFSKKIKTDK